MPLLNRSPCPRIAVRRTEITGMSQIRESRIRLARITVLLTLAEDRMLLMALS
jgi:hypothetical protein